MTTIEVSLHSLTQYRVAGIDFFVVIFTNLTHNYLDYYKNMTKYESSKWSLFSRNNVKKY